MHTKPLVSCTCIERLVDRSISLHYSSVYVSIRMVTFNFTDCVQTDRQGLCECMRVYNRCRCTWAMVCVQCSPLPPCRSFSVGPVGHLSCTPSSVCRAVAMQRSFICINWFALCCNSMQTHSEQSRTEHSLILSGQCVQCSVIIAIARQAGK